MQTASAVPPALSGSRPRISHELSHSRADYRETRASLRKTALLRSRSRQTLQIALQFTLPLADTQTPRRPLEPLTNSHLIIPRQRSFLISTSERNRHLSVLKPRIVHPSDVHTSVPTLLREKLVVANGDGCRRMAMMMHFGAYETIKFWELHSCSIRML